MAKTKADYLQRGKLDFALVQIGNSYARARLAAFEGAESWQAKAYMQGMGEADAQGMGEATEIIYVSQQSGDFPYVLTDSIDDLGAYATLAAAIHECEKMKACGEIAGYVVDAEEIETPATPDDKSVEHAARANPIGDDSAYRAMMARPDGEAMELRGIMVAANRARAESLRAKHHGVLYEAVGLRMTNGYATLRRFGYPADEALSLARKGDAV